MRLAITCGYSRSLHAIALIHRLAQEGHQVALCLRVGTLSLARVRFYWRQLGGNGLRRKLATRVWSGGKRSLEHRDETTAMRAYLRDRGITSQTTGEACRSAGAREQVVRSLNGAPALDALRQSSVDLIIYGGGGILSQAFLDAAPLGVLNTHGGPLPQFRGMNAGEWALFHGVRPTVTAHRVEAAVDRGPILFQREVPIEVWKHGIAYGRGACTCEVVEANVDAVQRMAAGEISAQSQREFEGRVFSVMASPLIDVVERWIAEDRIPYTDPKDFRFPSLPTEA